MTKPDYKQIKEKLVSLTRDLMLVPTTASRPEEIVRGLRLVRNHLEGLEKVQLMDHEDKGVPSFVALPEGIKKPEILICAHIDVVDYPSSAFTSKVVDGRIVGPGAGDMKGCLAVGLEIFRHFHGLHPGISLGLAITSDEEAGGASGIGFLVDKKDLRCGVALVPDGGSIDQVTTHEKGILHMKLRCKGRFSHASRPWEGNNALRVLISNYLKLEHLFSGWPSDADCWHPTCALTMIKTTNEVINRIPDYAEAVLDIRFPQPHTSSELLKNIKDTMDDDVEVEVIIKAEPSDLKPDPLYFEMTQKITGGKVRESRDHGGSDARFIAEQGTPVIISRPLVGNLHSEEEWIDIESMLTFYKIYESYVTKKLLK